MRKRRRVTGADGPGMIVWLGVVGVGAAAGLAAAGEPAARSVHIASLDLDNGIIEVRNDGPAAVSLDGWRFCTHSAEQALRYTSPTGLFGVTLEPAASLFVHLNDDAPAGPDAVNASEVGTFANRFGQGPYALQLFWPNGGSLNFNSTDDMADHVQWNVGGVNNGVASARSQQAVNAGLWTGAADWIATTGATLMVRLVDDAAVRNGPDDFEADEAGGGCSPADIAPPFNLLDLADIGAFVSAFSSGGAAADIAVPIGSLDLEDLRAFIEAYVSGCP